jgi:hypothetical protein
MPALCRQASAHAPPTPTPPDVHSRCQPDARPMPPGWVLPFPLFLLLLRPLAGRWPPPHRRWPPPHRRWPQPSDSAGSLSECKGRREQRGEEDQSAEGSNVSEEDPSAESGSRTCYTRCALCRHLRPDPTHKTGRATMGRRWKPGWSYVPSSCVPCANIKKKIKGQM